uniref:Calcineurin-like phosphoesterase domain containing 1 n=1 Tax=Acanthochromis polyacanthus TaxID=80966 RepID=A0A3Q1G735_9TELE
GIVDTAACRRQEIGNCISVPTDFTLYLSSPLLSHSLFPSVFFLYHLSLLFRKLLQSHASYLILTTFICKSDTIHKQDTPFRDGQERDLKAALKGTDPSIPLVFVSGNHDLGNTPTPSTVEQYCNAWGDDYFSFWVGGVLCLVLNSQLFYDASACPQLKEAQETWLEAQLSRASSSTEPKPKHVLVFQHIPLYLESPDEEEQYFNLQREVRQNLLDRFKKAGVKAVFSGHYHRNAGGCHGGLDMVVSSAIGCQLGDDPHGVRVVVVTADSVIHRYHSLEQLRAQGMDEDLRKLLQA